MIFVTTNNLFDMTKAVHGFQILYSTARLQTSLVPSMSCTLGIGRDGTDTALSSAFTAWQSRLPAVKMVVPISVSSLITITLVCLNSPVTHYHKMY